MMTQIAEVKAQSKCIHKSTSDRHHQYCSAFTNPQAIDIISNVLPFHFIERHDKHRVYYYTTTSLSVSWGKKEKRGRRRVFPISTYHTTLSSNRGKKESPNPRPSYLMNICGCRWDSHDVTKSTMRCAIFILWIDDVCWPTPFFLFLSHLCPFLFRFSHIHYRVAATTHHHAAS